MTRPLRIGLTGGIASGKSTVTQRFAELGIPVIDADVASRTVVEPGTPGLAQVVRALWRRTCSQVANSIGVHCEIGYSRTHPCARPWMPSSIP